MIEQYMKYENTVTGIKYKLFMGFVSPQFIPAIWILNQTKDL